MKKIIAMLALVYGGFALSRMMPELGFYVFLLPPVVGLCFLLRRNTGPAKYDRAKTRGAVQAVRAGMSYTQASREYGVPEQAIRKHRLQVFHIYFD